MATIYDILTPDWLKQNILNGMDFTDRFGVALPDTIIEQSIRTAVRRAETEFDLCINPLSVALEMHDIRWETAAAWWPLITRKRPLQNTPTIKLCLGPLQLYDLPEGWVQPVQPKYGRINIFPIMYNSAPSNVQVIIPALRTFTIGQYVPGGWHVSYTAGFRVETDTVSFAIGETSKAVELATTFPDNDYQVNLEVVNPDPLDAAIVPSVINLGPRGFGIALSAAPQAPLTVAWTLNNIPADLLLYLGLRAAVLPLNVAGANLVPPGMASRSISVDGLSQSLTSTQTAQTLGYTNWVTQLNAMAEELRYQIAANWRAPHVMVF